MAHKYTLPKDKTHPLIYVPLAIVGDWLFGIAGIFAAYAMSNIVMGAVSYAWARRSVAEQCERNQHRKPVASAPTDPALARYATAPDSTRRS